MALDATIRGGVSGAPARGRADSGLSIVVPLFNEAGNLAALHARIIEVGRPPHEAAPVSATAMRSSRGHHPRGLSFG